MPKHCSGVGTHNPKVSAPLDIHRTILSEEQRKKIVKLHTDSDSPMSIQAIARRFGVGYKAIWEVIAEFHAAQDQRKPEREDRDHGLAKRVAAKTKTARTRKRKKPFSGTLWLGLKGSKDFTR